MFSLIAFVSFVEIEPKQTNMLGSIEKKPGTLLQTHMKHKAESIVLHLEPITTFEKSNDEKVLELREEPIGIIKDYKFKPQSDNLNEHKKSLHFLVALASILSVIC